MKKASKLRGVNGRVIYFHTQHIWTQASHRSANPMPVELQIGGVWIVTIKTPLCSLPPLTRRNLRRWIWVWSGSFFWHRFNGIANSLRGLARREHGPSDNGRVTPATQSCRGSLLMCCIGRLAPKTSGLTKQARINPCNSGLPEAALAADSLANSQTVARALTHPW